MSKKFVRSKFRRCNTYTKVIAFLLNRFNGIQCTDKAYKDYMNIKQDDLKPLHYFKLIADAYDVYSMMVEQVKLHVHK